MRTFIRFHNESYRIINIRVDSIYTVEILRAIKRNQINCEWKYWSVHHTNKKILFLRAISNFARPKLVLFNNEVLK